MKNDFHSILIISNNQNSIDNWLQEELKSINHQLSFNNPDIFFIKEEYSIDKVREIKKFLSQKPYNHSSKIVIIYDSQNLNIESQNALLKTIEEIGDNYIFLITNNKNNLLSTIISRSHQIKLKNVSKTLGQIMETNGNLSLKDYQKDEVKPLLEEQLYLYQNLLVQKPSPKTAQKIKVIIKCLDMIKHNVDPLLALDYFFLTPIS